jgi:hypothetical protein
MFFKQPYREKTLEKENSREVGEMYLNLTQFF